MQRIYFQADKEIISILWKLSKRKHYYFWIEIQNVRSKILNGVVRKPHFHLSLPFDIQIQTSPFCKRINFCAALALTQTCVYAACSLETCINIPYISLPMYSISNRSIWLAYAFQPSHYFKPSACPARKDQPAGWHWKPDFFRRYFPMICSKLNSKHISQHRWLQSRRIGIDQHKQRLVTEQFPA